MDIVALLSNAFSAVAKVFGYAQHRSELKNSPTVIQGAKNVQQNKVQDTVTKHVADRDLDKVRKDISLLLVAALFLSTGCTSTVVAPQVKPTTVAFDGNEQNGGLIRFQPLPDGRGVLTSAARERYNMLVRLYGSEFLVPLEKDSGISPGQFEEPYGPTYLIDAQHLVYFSTMADWYRNKRAPK